MRPPWSLLGYLGGLAVGAWLGSFLGDPWMTLLAAAGGLVGFVTVSHVTGRPL